MAKKTLKYLSLGLSALSAICAFVGAIVDGKKAELDMTEEIEKAVAKRFQSTTKES